MILLAALTETDTRIDDYSFSRNTASGGAVNRRFQFRKERTHHVLHWTEPHPRFRSSAHVVQNQSSVVLHDGLYEVGFPRQARTR